MQVSVTAQVWLRGLRAPAKYQERSRTACEARTAGVAAAWSKAGGAPHLAGIFAIQTRQAPEPKTACKLTS